MHQHTYRVRIELSNGGRFSATCIARDAAEARKKAQQLLDLHPGSHIVRIARA
jgi:hypothetical protein